VVLIAAPCTNSTLLTVSMQRTYRRRLEHVLLYCQGCSHDLVGTKTRTNKPWLSHETTAILEYKSATKVRGDQVERKRLQSVFRAKAKADRETYLTRILDDVEEG